MLRRWLIDGAGVSLLPRFWIERELSDRRLVRLLRKYEVAAGGIYAVHAHRKNTPKKISELVSFLRGAFEAAGMS